MEYKTLAEFYERLEKTTKRLEKTFIIAELLLKTPDKELSDVVYLLQGRVFPAWDERRIGMSSKLLVKAVAKATGESTVKVEKLWARMGGLGMVAEELVENKRHHTLASFSKELTVEKVITNIKALAEMEGKGTVDRKVNLIVELLATASPSESKYIVRTVLEELRTGVGEGVLRDGLVWAYLPKVIGIFFSCEKCSTLNPKSVKCLECGEKLNVKFKDEIKKVINNWKVLKVQSVEDLKNLEKYDVVVVDEEKNARKVYDYILGLVQHAYDLATDFGIVARALKEKSLKGLKEITLKPGKPIKVMLYIKAQDMKEGLEVLGTPLVAEYKYDGFRMQVHKTSRGEIKLFTRRLDDVTNQFPDVVEIVKNNVKANNFIIDCEIMGLDPKTGRFKPFQFISQRIRRKYDIHKLVKELPVVVEVFDVMIINGENILNKPLKERKKRLSGIIKKQKGKIELVEGLVTGDEKKLERFYEKSLALGNEGIMLKKLDGMYKPGRRVGYGMKIKPVLETLDLVIIGAEWGEGKRGKWLSSFTLACRKGGEFLRIGKVGTGIKEKSEEGVSFDELTKMLKPLITKTTGKTVKINPQVIVEVKYEEIQKSPTYNSGYALRFPRVIRLREEKGLSDINSIKDIERIYDHQRK